MSTFVIAGSFNMQYMCYKLCALACDANTSVLIPKYGHHTWQLFHYCKYLNPGCLFGEHIIEPDKLI
jgi:hypothetical protein